LRKNNLNNKSFDKNLLKEKQFNEQPSLFVRGKNFLVNYSELRNLGEGSNIIKKEGKIFLFQGLRKMMK
jgi:hypothetical protein